MYIRRFSHAKKTVLQNVQAIITTAIAHSNNNNSLRVRVKPRYKVFVRINECERNVLVVVKSGELCGIFSTRRLKLPYSEREILTIDLLGRYASRISFLRLFRRRPQPFCIRFRQRATLSSQACARAFFSYMNASHQHSCFEIARIPTYFIECRIQSPCKIVN